MLGWNTREEFKLEKLLEEQRASSEQETRYRDKKFSNEQEWNTKDEQVSEKDVTKIIKAPSEQKWTLQ